MHHAYVISDEVEQGITKAEALIEQELGLTLRANPDVVIFRHGLFSVEDARRVVDVAVQAPIGGDKKVVVIAASRMYHEAQNALLKLFEEPPAGLTLFLVLPTHGALLPTLRSRVQLLGGDTRQEASEEAQAFAKASKEKRTALIKKLSSGKDDVERREHRETALALVNGIEQLVYQKGIDSATVPLLEEVAVLRGYLYDRAAPVKMILEHLSLVLPRDLVE